VVNGYATLGLKVNTNILLWLQSDNLDSIQDLTNQLMHSKIGKSLHITYTFLGIARPTQYSPDSQDHKQTDRKGRKYLIIYPFTKTQEWYLLNFKERSKLMRGHIDIGMKHPKVEQLLLYSFGLDDQEFIVSYETNDLLDFQTLVMELRSDKVRAYTKKDTPIFTCIYKPLDKVLDYL
jgi:chlorite dismutase